MFVVIIIIIIIISSSISISNTILCVTFLERQDLDFERKHSKSWLRPLGTTYQFQIPPDSRLKSPDSEVGKRPWS